jgi:hypothetical protein
MVQEIAGNFDKDKVITGSPYSLHTEYSYMPRGFNSKIIKDLNNITTAQRNNVPQLWYSKEWAHEFFIFIERLIGPNDPPEVLEIHPPFRDYCNSFDHFLNVFKVFYDLFHNKYPKTLVLIENRFGTMYKGEKFLLATCADVLEFCGILKRTDISLKIVLDYPQIFSAELINMNNVSLKKILAFNKELSKYRNVIGGFHMWGKRKSGNGRWTPHTGNFDTFFNYNKEMKFEFLHSVSQTFDDDIERYFVPEVNSGEEDVFSIVSDMENSGFKFITDEKNIQQLIRIKWEGTNPFLELFNRFTEEVINVPVSGYLSIRVLAVRHCSGSYELGTHKHIPCKHNIILEEQCICEECENINGFKHCISCHGEKCFTYNKIALNYCNQKHFVYLAYFPKDIVKVGTAHEMRKEERLIEQGALYRILIAEAPTGKIARQIENVICKLGYKSLVSSKHKIQHLQFTKTENEIQELLDIAYNHIRKNLNSEFQEYLLNPYIYSNNKELVETLTIALKQTKQLQLTMFDDMFEPQYHVISDVSYIVGNIAAVVGSIVLLKKSGNTLHAFNFKEIYGRDIILE